MMTRMRAATDRAHWSVRALAATVSVGVALVAVSGCNWRLEGEPVTWPSPDDVTQQRDAAALREQHIVDALNHPEESGVARAAVATVAAIAAPAHREALGGVYVPRPDEVPAAYEGRLADAVRDSRDQALATAATTSDQEFAALMGSIGLTHAFAAWYGATENARAAGLTIDAAVERSLPSVGPVTHPPVLPEQTALDGETLMELAVAHDQARFLYETIAARSQSTTRVNARDRMDIHAARSDALAELSGVTDTRTHVYSLPLDRVTGAEAQAQTARETEQALGWRYATLAASADATDRMWALSAAFDAYTASAALPGFTPSEFPVLPGLDVDGVGPGAAPSPDGADTN